MVALFTSDVNCPKAVHVHMVDVDAIPSQQECDKECVARRAGKMQWRALGREVDVRVCTYEKT
eukprot:3827683-Prymnesium_polylepis.1